jgi:hypothetical protein
MDSKYGAPVLVSHFVNDTIPSIASIVDNDIDLPVAKVCGGFH